MRRSRKATGTHRDVCWTGLTVLSTLMRPVISCKLTNVLRKYFFLCLDTLLLLGSVKTPDSSVRDLLVASLSVYLKIIMPMHAFRPYMGRMSSFSTSLQPTLTLLSRIPNTFLASSPTIVKSVAILVLFPPFYLAP